MNGLVDRHRMDIVMIKTECFEPVDKKVEVVQEIFRLFKLGYGLQQIANKLTVDQRDIEQNGTKTKSNILLRILSMQDI